jgi:sphingosine kinase
MTSQSAPTDPFVDPDPSFDHGRHSFAADSTLAVGRNATLTLGTDSLIVLDEAFEKGDSSNCCGLWSSGMIQ